MPIQPSIQVDTSKADKALKGDAKAMPKVTAAALNRTADEARTALVKQLPQHFTVRTPWVAKGIRTEKATPSKLFARVYSKDQFMSAQESGGTKNPKDGGHVAIPIMGLQRGEKRTKVTRPRDWPSRLKNSYTIEEENGRILVFQRPGRKGRRPKGTRRGSKASPMPSRLMYVLAPSVRIKPRWRFLEQVTHVVNERWQVNVDGYLRMALDGRLK